jgi:hypothetical protein
VQLDPADARAHGGRAGQLFHKADQALALVPYDAEIMTTLACMISSGDDEALLPTGLAAGQDHDIARSPVTPDDLMDQQFVETRRQRPLTSTSTPRRRASCA